MRASAHVKPVKLRNVGLSLILALAGWVAPWVLWAALPSPLPRRVRGPAPEMVYVRRTAGMEAAVWSPVLISLPDRLGLGMTRHAEGPSIWSPLRAPSLPPAYAAPSGPTVGSVSSVDIGPLCAVASPGLEAYKPRYLEKLAGPRPTQRPGSIVIAPALQAAGIVFPELTDVLAAGAMASRPGMSVHVTLGPDGRVRHAFLEMSSGNAELDGRVLRALRRGTAPKGVSASGLVQLFFPSPREAGNRPDRG